MKRRLTVVNLKSGTVLRGFLRYRRGVATLKGMVAEPVTILADRGQALKPPRVVDGESRIRVSDIDWVQVP